MNSRADAQQAGASRTKPTLFAIVILNLNIMIRWLRAEASLKVHLCRSPELA
jgi:hypothetical protein